MIRRNGRTWTAIAICMSMLLGSQTALPPVAFAQEHEEPFPLLFQTHEASVGEPLVLVTQAVDQTPQEVGKFSFGKNTSSPLSGIAGTLPLIKNAGFDFAEEILPVMRWKDDDGYDVYAININQKNTALWKDITSGKTSIWDNAKRSFNNVQKPGGMKFKPVFLVQGLLKQKDKDSKGEAAIIGGVCGSVQGQYLIFTGEFSLTGTGGVKAGFKYEPSQGPSFDGNVDLTMALTPKIAGGVGVAYIGRFGVYGSGTFDTSVRILPKNEAGWNYARLSASIGLEVIGLIFRLWHTDLWKGGPWDLIDPRPGMKSLAQSEGYDIRPLFVAAAEHGGTVMPLHVMSTSKQWYGNVFEYVDAPHLADGTDTGADNPQGYIDDDMSNEQSTPQDGLRLLERDVFPDARVRIVNVNNGAVMCWLESDPNDPNETNSTRLMWSRYDPDEDTWSEPRRVDTRGLDTAEFEPDLFADQDGNVHATWLSASKEIPSQAANLETVTNLLEVRYACLASDRDDFSPSELVSPSDAQLTSYAEEAAADALLAQEADGSEGLEAIETTFTEDATDDTDDETTPTDAIVTLSETSQTTPPEGQETQDAQPTSGETASDQDAGPADGQEDEMSAEALLAQSDDAGNVTLVAQAETIGGYFRTAPQVAALKDNVVVGWSTTPVKNLSDYNGNHQVIVAKRTLNGNGGATWEAQDAIDYDSTYEITSLDAGLVGQEPAVAWTYNDLYMDDYGSVGSSPLQPSTLVLSTASTLPETISNNDAENVNFAFKGSDGALVWSEPGADDTSNLMVLTSVGGNPVEQLKDADLAPDYQIDGDLNHMALISYPGWEAGDSAENSTTDIYGRVLTGGTELSEENLLVAHEDDLTSHDVAFVRDAPLVALAAERGIGEPTTDMRSADLLVAKGDSLERLAVVDFDYDVDDIKPNAKVRAWVTVANKGLVPIVGGVSASIIDDRSNYYLGAGSYDADIAVDEEVRIPVEFTIPADFDPQGALDVSVKANFKDLRAIDSIALNLDTVLIGSDFGSTDTDNPDDSGKGGKRSDTNPPSTPDGTVRGLGRWYYDNGWHYNGNWYFGNGFNSYNRPVERTNTTATSTGTSANATASTPAKSSKVERISGPNRYDTMKATVLAAFKQSDWAVLASGEGFADALAAQSLAGAHRAPVVLTAGNQLSPQAKEVLERLGCKHVLVVGGGAAVSDAVMAEANAVCGDAKRIAGGDRYQTSLAIMRETAAAGGASDTVFVATGTNFADALSAGPVSWKLTSPVVLAGADKLLTDDAVSAIKANPQIKRIVLLGGDSVVSDAIKDQLGSGYQFVRLSGQDRYQTSAAIASWAANQGLGWTRPHVATGSNFADALAGAASAGLNSSCLLLTDTASSPTMAELKKHASDVKSVTLLGGEQAVSRDVEDFLATEVVS